MNAQSVVTFESLDSAIRHPNGQRVPLLLPLREGRNLPPIFMAHGIGDTVLGLLPLANQMQVSNPIYGIQARGVDGIDEPFDTIEKMADCYTSEIREVQSRGPYVLVGYSMGGLVMLEIARRLVDAGERIEHLVMIDSYVNRRAMPVLQQAPLLMRIGVHRAKLALARHSNSANSSHQGALPLPPAMLRVTDFEYRAWRAYKPRFYPGSVKFIRASVPSFFPANPVPVWNRWIQDFQVETVSGNHLELLTTHVTSVAASVSRYLDGARQ